MLEFEGVSAGYLPEVDVLRHVSLVVEEGTITSIIGANGAGKSTVLRTAFGILRPRTGRVRVGGEDVTGFRPRDALSRGIAYVAQGRCNFPAMSVRENLQVACHTRPGPAVAPDVERMLDEFPILRGKAAEMAGNLSGGQQQLLEMAMALMVRPRVLLIDEPTLGLSPKLFDEVFRYIQMVRTQGTTVLMVEQNAARALEISDFAIVLELGEKRLEGTGREILHNPTVKEHYLGGKIRSG